MRLLYTKVFQIVQTISLSVFCFFATSCDNLEEDDDDTNTSSEKDLNQNSHPGDFHADYLTSSKYTNIVIEVDVLEGALPDEESTELMSSAFSLLEDYIEILCNKPAGIVLKFPQETIPVSVDNDSFSIYEVNDLELSYRDEYRNNNTATLYFILLNGHSDQDTDSSKILGYAYHGSSMGIFMETLMMYENPNVREASVKTVIIHEFGHLLGLVDNGIDMVEYHKDPNSEHGDHCENEDCMMYWANNTSPKTALTGDVPDFDDACLEDIKNAGGKDAISISQPNERYTHDF